jgi:hypothetical protein
MDAVMSLQRVVGPRCSSVGVPNASEQMPVSLRQHPNGGYDDVQAANPSETDEFS